MRTAPDLARKRSGPALTLLLALALSLAACGVRGGPKAPEAEPGDYAYPATYPYPGTTLRTVREVEEEEVREDNDFGSNRLSPGDFDRTTTRTYGTE